MSARAFVVSLVLLAAVACAPEGAPDPQLAPLVAANDVADTNVALVTGAREVVPVEADDPSKGAAEPLVVIVEYSDFQCPHCGRFASALDELVVAYPDDVRIVFKQFPLPMHPDAEIGARAALAARAQGKFWAMHDRLFANRSKMSRDDVVDHAKALGLELPAFETALDDGSTGARVAADKRAGAVIGVRGTPSFFVNGLPFSGALPPEELGAVVEQERDLGRRLVEAGTPRAHVPGVIMRAAGKATAAATPPSSP
jgi:protein-disulfide isomerase